MAPRDPKWDLRSAAEILGKLPSSLQTAVVKSCTNIASEEDIREKAVACSIPYQQLQEAIDAANHILVSLRPLRETAVDQILKDLPLSVDLARTIKCCCILGGNGNACTLGRILDVKWKVSVVAVTDQCKNLNTPLVTFLLTVEQGGKTQDHIMEFTVPEFEKFASTIEEMAATVET